VAFVDYGYIGAEPSMTMDGSDHTGGGLGLRYETPIGPLRLDVATPLSGDSVFGELEIYIGIGQAF
jgi:translocation and assembly module TamA